MMGEIIKLVAIGTVVLFAFTTVGIAVDFEECQDCHQDIYVTWSSSPHGSTSCAICHEAPEGGFDAHISSPSDPVPDVSLSSQVCGDCHSDIYDEWDEFSDEGFDMTTLASHSEPTEIAEPYVLHLGASCVACKSTDGGLINIAEAQAYDLDEETVHELGSPTEWTISCAACHDPHDSEPRIADTTLLCGNCHNTEGVSPDGNTPTVRHAQWEMVSTSGYADGTHPTAIGCVDCHMAEISADGIVETGHTFNFDAEKLSVSDVPGDCNTCHKDSLGSLIEEKQEPVRSGLADLNLLKEEASVALEAVNGTDDYELQRANYNNGQFYLTKIENDGSFGIHNLVTATEDLATSEKFFNMVLSGKTTAEPETSVPGFSVLMSIALLGVVSFLFRRNK